MTFNEWYEGSDADKWIEEALAMTEKSDVAELKKRAYERFVNCWSEGYDRGYDDGYEQCEYNHEWFDDCL